MTRRLQRLETQTNLFSVLVIKGTRLFFAFFALPPFFPKHSMTIRLQSSENRNNLFSVLGIEETRFCCFCFSPSPFFVDDCKLPPESQPTRCCWRSKLPFETPADSQTCHLRSKGLARFYYLYSFRLLPGILPSYCLSSPFIELFVSSPAIFKHKVRRVMKIHIVFCGFVVCVFTWHDLTSLVQLALNIIIGII